ncbi:Putative cytoplasmic protein USSDB7A [hydrothermal vent metagenome]|uniref:Cytoplasmic protein USSDB7A n=1 Tax=hydrothermal vent metagenome TaxID=652676 RepID=A0A3B1B0Z3_9ZZZZ
MAIYLDYEGIKGNVTAEGYEGMIALKYFKFNVSRKISMEPGAMANRENALPELSTVYIEKFSDASTPALFKVSVAGSEGKQAK